MPLQQRLLLIVGAILALWVVARNIRKNKILMSDAIFWVVLATVLVVVAAFPGITFFFANLFGFMSPANLVFLIVVALLLCKVFADSIEISQLKNKLEILAQDVALRDGEPSVEGSQSKLEKLRSTRGAHHITTEAKQHESTSHENTGSIPDFLSRTR